MLVSFEINSDFPEMEILPVSKLFLRLQISEAIVGNAKLGTLMIHLGENPVVRLYGRERQPRIIVAI